MSRKFTVPIALPADPTNPLEAATKQYVDAHAGGGGGGAVGPSMSGTWNFHSGDGALPGTGEVSCSSADSLGNLSTAHTLRFSRFDANGVDFAGVLAAMPLHSGIVVQFQTDPTNWVSYQINSATPDDTYYEMYPYVLSNGPGSVVGTAWSKVVAHFIPLISLPVGGAPGYLLTQRSTYSGDVQWAPISLPPVNGFLSDSQLGQTIDRSRNIVDLPGVLTSGRVHLAAVYMQGGVNLTYITFYSGTTAAAGITHLMFGVYDSTGVLVAQTDDWPGAAWFASQNKFLPIQGTGYIIPESGRYYLAILVVATTPPSLTGVTMGLWSNITPYMAARGNSGRTTLPSEVSMTSNTSLVFATYQ